MTDTEALKALVAEASKQQAIIDAHHADAVDRAFAQERLQRVKWKIGDSWRTLERMLASQMGDENTITLDKRDLFDFVRSEIKQALDEPVGLTESEAWEEAHRRTEDCLGKLYAAPAAGMDAELVAGRICQYLIDQLGHDTDNTDRAEIAAIIRHMVK